MKFRLRLVVAVAAAALLPVGASPSTAAADDGCAITDFSPRLAVVGTVPVETAADISTAGDCSMFEQWDLAVEGVFSTSSEDGGYVYLDPHDNSLAGLHNVSANYRGSNPEDGNQLTAAQEWTGGFDLKRATSWWSFDASPEPVVKGAMLTIGGQLSVADWNAQQDVGFENAVVQVEFRTDAGSYAPVKTVRTDDTGAVRTTVTADKTGVWRLRYLGDDMHSASAAVGDAVKVVPPTACTGVAKCRIVKSIDVDGDGKKDSVGVTSRGLTGENGKITVRVRRANGKIMQTTGDKVHWAPKPFIGAAPVDGAPGAEILVGDEVGAHYEQFRMITYRRGKLVTAPPPPKAGISNRSSRWGIDSSLNSNIGLYRSVSGRTVKMTVKTAFDFSGNFSRYTGKTKVYTWKSSKWALKSSKTKHYTLSQTAGIGGLHIKGLPYYGE